MKQKGVWTPGKAAALIILAACLCIAGFFGYRHLRNAAVTDDGEEVYVTSVAYLTGANVSGTVNRFAGVVESQETWSVDPNSEFKVAAVLVTVGQEVSEGQALFTYDVNAFQDQLAKAQIELERLNAERNALDDTIAALAKQQKKADKDQQANFTIQIKQQELERKQKEYDITVKRSEIEKIQDNINNATVYSKISGVVQSINESGSSDTQTGTDNSFIKIMKTGDLRVKGTVNEQNIGQIYEGLPVIVHSRVDESLTWSGTVTKIDRENTQSNPYASMFGGEGSSGSNYPFYVELSGSDGLMMGQHVYLEPDLGQNDAEAHQGIWLDSYYIDETTDPFVWADDGGKLVKKPVTLGERDDELGKVQILDGLTESDLIAFPEDTLHEGMTTLDSAYMTEEETAEDEEELA
jgi:HlyD family secretion protein